MKSPKRPDPPPPINLAAITRIAVTPEMATRMGALPVCGPYQPGEEDWMLLRALEDFEAAGRWRSVVIVNESVRAKMAGHRTTPGISLWRLAAQLAPTAEPTPRPKPKAKKQVRARAFRTKPKGLSSNGLGLDAPARKGGSEA